MPYPALETLGNIDAVTRPFQYEVCCLYLLINFKCEYIQAGLNFNAQIWILIGISVVAIATVIWKISSLEFLMFNNQREVITNEKKISLIRSFRSLFHFQNIRKMLLFSNITFFKFFSNKTV